MNVKKLFFIALASVLIVSPITGMAKDHDKMHADNKMSEKEMYGKSCCQAIQTPHALMMTKENEKMLMPLSVANTRIFNGIQSGNTDAIIAAAKEAVMAINSIKDVNLKNSLNDANRYANRLVEATTYSQMRLGYGLFASALSHHFVDCGEAPRIHKPEMQDKSAMRCKEKMMLKMKMHHYVPNLKVQEATMKNLLSLRLEMKQLRSTVMKNNVMGTEQTIKNISSLLLAINQQNKALIGYANKVSQALLLVEKAKTLLARIEAVDMVSKELFMLYDIIDMSGVSMEDLMDKKEMNKA